MIRVPGLYRKFLVALVGLLASGLLAGCGGRRDGAGAPAGSPSPSAFARDPDAVQLLFTYGSEKEAWITDVTTRFNASGAKTAGGRKIQVEAVAQGSGESIDDLLSGARKAQLTSPASAAFLKIGNAESRVKTGKDLIGETQNLVLSPVVIAMWKPMAEAIGWGKKPVGWGDILALAKDPAGWRSHGHPEWGAFKLGHTHPEYSNSGLIALLAEAYAGAGKLSGLTEADIGRPETERYVAGIESAIVHYGSSTGFFGKKMFANGPQYLSAAVLYESLVIESYAQKPPTAFPVVALYPKEGTFWSDHPVGIVEREWVTPEQREAAKVYIRYLLDRPQQERAKDFGFRPSAVDVPLGPPFDAAHGVDPKEPQTTLPVPPVEVIDAVRRLWHRDKKSSFVTLVFDTSGSMQESGKIEGARGGAEQLLTLLDDEDRFSLLPFNSKPTWAVQDVSLRDGRADAIGKVRGLFPSGGTALYDAIAEAYAAQLVENRKNPNRISAIVVLTDGEDTHSDRKLADLLREIRWDNEEKTVHVFTIGYGREAKQAVLQAIADATEARSYKGDPTNIRAVFREISTFF